MREIFKNKIGTVHYNQVEQVLYVEYKGTWDRFLVKQILDARLECHKSNPVKATFVEGIYVLGSFVDCIPDVDEFYEEVLKLKDYLCTASLISGNDQFSKLAVEVLERDILSVELKCFTDKREALDWMYRKIDLI